MELARLELRFESDRIEWDRIGSVRLDWIGRGGGAESLSLSLSNERRVRKKMTTMITIGRRYGHWPIFRPLDEIETETETEL